MVRLEERLGYTHKGTEAVLAGAALAHAAKLAGRISGDSTVAYSIAFARAAEAVLDMIIPARAHWLRALIAEMERIANHLGDIGAICNDASFAIMHEMYRVTSEPLLNSTDIEARRADAGGGRDEKETDMHPAGSAVRIRAR